MSAFRVPHERQKPGQTRRQPTRPVAPRRGGDGPLILGLACLLFSIYLFTFSGRYHSSDEMSMLVATDSLARRGAWDTDLLRWMGEQQGSFGPDGHLYSRKGIGTTLAALPLYWLALRFQGLGNVQAAMLTNGLITSLTAALVLVLARRLGYGCGPSLLAGLGYGLATMAWPYARTLFSEPLAGLGLMACAYYLVRYRDVSRGGRETPPAAQDGRAGGLARLRSRLPGGGSLLLAGSGLALALLARLNNAIVAPFFGLLLLAYLARGYGWRRGGYAAWLQAMALFALPVVAALALTAWYNWLRFGSPLVTGYLPEENFSTPFFEGFYGLLLSPGKGLVWYNPLLLGAIAAWPALYRRGRAEALLFLAVVLANVAFYAPWYLWWAGHGWGPRFLVAVLPFAALALAPAFEAARRHRAVAAALVLLAVLSLAAQVAGVAVSWDLYLEDVYGELGLYHPATLFDPAYSPLLRQWAYLRPGNLDLAWAQGGTVDWGVVLLGLSGIAVAILGLVEALQRRPATAGTWLPLLLAFVTLRVLFAAGPTGDVAAVARAVAGMERPREAVALAESLWTEAWQNAYDGGLRLWGLPDTGEVPGAPAGTWQVARASASPAAVRFWAGEAGTALHLPADRPAGDNRLPVPALEPAPQLGSLALLRGVDVAGRQAWPGESLEVTLCWQALATTATSYTVFVQLLDEEGNKAGQVDALPCGGSCPTTVWQPGDLVGEHYELAVEPGARPGRYRLVAGLYDLATGERLPVAGDPGQGASDDLVLLTTIEVRQSR